jgi:ABC-type Mn2+/Zn2+ transport system permease subunit
MKKNLNKIKGAFYSLVGIFILLLGYFIIPFSQEYKRALFPVVAVLGMIFFVLGGILIYLTIKSKIEKKLKIFLLLTGGSSVGFLLSILLHNLVYGLMTYLFGEGFWNGGDEAFFFIIGLFVCPIVFLVGVIGSFILLNKK